MRKMLFVNIDHKRYGALWIENLNQYHIMRIGLNGPVGVNLDPAGPTYKKVVREIQKQINDR